MKSKLELIAGGLAKQSSMMMKFNQFGYLKSLNKPLKIAPRKFFENKRQGLFNKVQTLPLFAKVSMTYSRVCNSAQLLILQFGHALP